MAIWQSIDQTPIPLNIGRIWLSDRDGNVRRAMSWTWPILKRREPGKYRQWMTRGRREIEPGAAGEAGEQGNNLEVDQSDADPDEHRADLACR